MPRKILSEEEKALSKERKRLKNLEIIRQKRNNLDYRAREAKSKREKRVANRKRKLNSEIDVNQPSTSSNVEMFEDERATYMQEYKKRKQLKPFQNEIINGVFNILEGEIFLSIDMKVCAVASCRKDSSKYPGVVFYNLPRDPCAKGEWLDALGLKHTEGSQSIKVCDAHFRSKDFCAGKRQLKSHAIPVLNLGGGKIEPLDSDDEFMQCDSDNDDILLEVKKLTAAEAMMNRKIKEEEPEEKPVDEQEPETGRRPSRRAAAREAAKKIFNTVHNYGCVPEAEDSAAVNINVSRVSNTASRTPHKPRQRYPNPIKIPPPNIDLVMECHEELLSTVQAEALLQAQLQYNMVMKTLRSLKANNVRIICQSADSPIPVDETGNNDSPVVKTQADDTPPSGKPNIVTVHAVKKDNGSVYPMELSTNVPSPAPSILS